MRGRDHLGSTTQQSAALHKYPSRPRENARICRRPDGCEMPSLLLATPYGVDAAIGASATGVQENPRLARLRSTSPRERAAMPLGAV